MPDLIMTAELEDVAEAHQIAVDVRLGMIERVTDSRLSGEMNDRSAIGLRKCSRQTRAIGEVDGDSEVFHTASLYAIDDRGDMVLIWSFGTPASGIAADLEHLLDQVA